MINISPESIERHFSRLGAIGNLGPFREDGFLRAAWSHEETAAMEYIREAGQDCGLIPSYDQIGNLFLTTPGEAQGVVQVGSHLDTVPHGGLFDGGAGIVAGLEAILALRHQWRELRWRLELVIWRGEESATFGAVCKGSQAAFGQNDPNILLKKFDGQTLEQVIIEQGYNPGFIQNREPTLSQERINTIAAHFELHIEQARKLEIDGLDIGIVTSIRGTVRLRVIVVGEAAHSGGTPMGTTYRKDANLAMAYMQVELDKLAHQQLRQGHDLVQTVGLLNSDRDYNMFNPRLYENALTKVSPYGYFTLDMRSNNQLFLESYVETAREIIRTVARTFRVHVRIQEICLLPPVERLDGALQAAIETSCRELGYGYERLPSGALHDVAVVASQKRSDGTPIPAALIFIPCKDGISHNPKEYASPEAIQKGAMVLASTLYQITR